MSATCHGQPSAPVECTGKLQVESAAQSRGREMCASSGHGARSRYALGPVGHSGIAYGRRYPDAVRSERRRARRHGAAGGAGRRSGAAREKRIRRHGRALSVSPAERKDLQKSGFITL